MEIEEVRQVLQSEEQRLSTMRDDLRAGDELDSDERMQAGGELSTADQHPADLGSEQNQREVTLSMIEQVEAELSDVENAMAKLDQGTYGSCEACGKPIGEERLAAMPTARFCIDDQAKAERDVVDLRGSTIDTFGTNDAETPI